MKNTSIAILGHHFNSDPYFNLVDHDAHCSVIDLPSPMSLELKGKASPSTTGSGQRPAHVVPAPGIARRVSLQRQHRLLKLRSAVLAVRTIVAEVVFLFDEPGRGGHAHGRSRRFAVSHIQQLAIYVTHIALQVPMGDLATGFGKDVTTIAHACARVEDRRDCEAYDRLVSAIERMVVAVFAPHRAIRN